MELMLAKSMLDII